MSSPSANGRASGVRAKRTGASSSLGEGTLAAPSLLDIRREDDGEIAFAGAAAEVVPFERGAPQGPVPRWRRSGFRADLFAGIAIGVR